MQHAVRGTCMYHACNGNLPVPTHVGNTCVCINTNETLASVLIISLIVSHPDLGF